MTKYLDIYELSEILGKSRATIRKALKSNARTVPPRMHIHGTRMLRWRKSDVDVWLEEQMALDSNG